MEESYNMSLSIRIIGLITTTIGAFFGYGIYLFVLNIYLLSAWISEYINAPESLAIVATVVSVICLLGLFIIAGIIVVYLLFVGLVLLLSGDA